MPKPIARSIKIRKKYNKFFNIYIVYFLCPNIKIQFNFISIAANCPKALYNYAPYPYLL